MALYRKRKETLDAIAEAKRLSKDPNAKKYDSVEQLLEDLEKWKVSIYDITLYKKMPSTGMQHW